MLDPYQSVFKRCKWQLHTMTFCHNQALFKMNTAAISLQPLVSDRADAVPVAEIWLAGATTAKLIGGAVLEAAFHCEHGYLLFVTDDIPFEDTLSIYLMDQDFQVLDSVNIGVAYSTGNFHLLREPSAREVQFSFIGGCNWRLTLLATPEFCLPLFNEPAGVRRKPSFKRWFKLSYSR